jgi:C1A family cysteine protease/predicted secreted protein
MELTGIHLNKRLAPLLICVILLLSSLLSFTNTVAAPPLDDPEQGEVRLSAKDDSRQIELKEGQVLAVSLESNPSTGYTWEIEEVNETILRQTGTIEFEPESRLLGAPGKQILRFEAVAAGQADLRLIYRRPWEKGMKPAKSFSLQVQGVGLFTQAKIPTPATENTIESPVLSLRRPEPVEGSKDPVSVAAQPTLGLPLAYNWCNEGGCTPVKNQGSCGSCWAFGTVGPLESKILIQDGLVKDLSEQYLVSCNTDGWGCNGGWWAHDYHLNEIPPGEPDAGAVYEADFPYQAADGSCNPPHTHHEKITSWRYVGSEYSVPPVDDIKQAIYDHGPVSAAVCVGSAFQGYSGGVFQTNEYCTGYVNHAIALVGWDDSQGVWYLRNSWGAGWGEGGYMNIKYGTSNVGYAANYIVYSGSGGGCQDAYELDDTFDDARSITVNGAAQYHTFHEGGEEDWVQFAVTAGETYTMTTSNLGASNDTVLELYDTDGMTKLVENNDCPGSGGGASCINNWSAPDSDTYFIKVRRHLNGAGGGSVKIYLPLIMKSGSSGNCTDYEYDLAIVDSSGCNDTQVVQDGGFENGNPNPFWVQSSGDYAIIGPSWWPYNYRTYTGSWSAWFGGYDNADDQLYQTISIPAGISSARLVLYLYVESEDDPDIPYDYFHVELQNASGGTLENFLWADNRMDNTRWWVGTMEWDDFSSYAGQTLRLFFQGTNNNNSLVTNFFVDDATFWTYCGSLPTGTQNIGPDGWAWEKVEAPPIYKLAPYNEKVPVKRKNE